MSTIHCPSVYVMTTAEVKPAHLCVLTCVSGCKSTILVYIRVCHSSLCVCEWVSLLSPVVTPASLRRMRSVQCHGWVSSPLASQEERAALPPSSQLCNAPRNYVVKRQMNRVIYSPGLFMRGRRGGVWGVG